MGLDAQAYAVRRNAPLDALLLPYRQACARARRVRARRAGGRVAERSLLADCAVTERRSAATGRDTWTSSRYARQRVACVARRDSSGAPLSGRFNVAAHRRCGIASAGRRRLALQEQGGLQGTVWSTTLGGAAGANAGRHRVNTKAHLSDARAASKRMHRAAARRSCLLQRRDRRGGRRGGEELDGLLRRKRNISKRVL